MGDGGWGIDIVIPRMKQGGGVKHGLIDGVGCELKDEEKRGMRIIGCYFLKPFIRAQSSPYV